MANSKQIRETIEDLADWITEKLLSRDRKIREIIDERIKLYEGWRETATNQVQYDMLQSKIDALQLLKKEF